MKKAVAIVRVSTTEQAQEERYSIPHQKNHISEECKHRGIDLVHIFEFVQSGAKVLKSTGKERDQVLKFIQEYNIDIVIVHELDRLARSMLDTLLFVDELDRINVVFISVHDGFDTSTPQGKLQMQILSAFSEYFRKQLASKVLGGLKERAKEGKPMGKRPFGRNITPDGFVVNEEEAKVIQLIADLYLNDNLGHRGIAEKLNNMGSRTQTGGLWSHQAIKDILDNENNTSTFVWDNIRINDALEPIISRETYERIQSRRKKKALLGGRSQNNNYLLSGLLRCVHCNGSVVGHTNRKGKYTYRYYVCTNYLTKGLVACPGEWIRADKIEELVLDRLQNIFKGTLINDQLLPSDIEDLHQTAVMKNKELENIKSMKQRAAVAYETGAYDLDFYNSRKATLAEQEKTILDDLAQIKTELEHRLSPKELKKRLTGRKDDVKQILKESNIQKTKVRLQGLIDHIEVQTAEDFKVFYRV